MWRANLQESDKPAQGQRVEPALGVEQVHRDVGLAKNWHQLTLAREHRRLHLECLAIGVREQRQKVIFSTAAVERGDELQHPDRPTQRPRVGLLDEDSLHAALFYGRRLHRPISSNGSFLALRERLCCGRRYVRDHGHASFAAHRPCHAATHERRAAPPRPRR
ncbi:MAG: hypothetical protein LC797_25005 [Chloroflexi bacterium]|nr:hypothetical protein [Chloroflexota bacterium]